ncbi:MAG: hypothetical protein HRU03_06505 [Nanoarchaeales archaeon]|nr:hypothetical protein [Nanoarchaeales archaeon]
MNYRYNKLQIISKKVFRKIFPVPKSPYTLGEIEDVCSINLVPPKKLEKFFTECIKKLQKIKGDKIGDYLEFGVFNGSSLGSMYLASKKLNLKNTRYFGFDAFQGLPEDCENEDEGVWKKGFYSCSYEKMNECLRRRNINLKDITFINGWYDETLNEKTKNKLKLNNLGIVFIDCDTYSSSKTVLNFIGPLIKKEVIICFDDWKLNDLDIKELGEYKAFNEFLDENLQFYSEEIKSYNRKSKCFILKLNNK